MNKGLVIFLSIAAVLIVIVELFISSYNQLQQLDETVNSNWAQVQNQLQRRSDLIPNLVNTVKGYATHEKTVFTDIAEARAKLSGAVQNKDVKAASQANGELSGALSRLLMVVENYPTLKANENFTALQDELTGTENRLAVARMDYNESVKTINAKIRTFPMVIIANMSGIKSREYFQVEESKKEAPTVNFN